MANERRLIDANALPRRTWLDGTVLVMAVQELDEAPTVDAVEVVRCRDCRYFMTDALGQQVCNRTFMMFHMESDDFCSYGEKRESGTQPQGEDV